MLVDPSLIVSRASGHAIATICAIEIFRGNWIEIVTALVNNVQHENAMIRRTSVTTLGFVCEQLKQTGK